MRTLVAVETSANVAAIIEEVSDMDDEAEAVREGKTEGFSENIVATVSKFLAVVDNTFEPTEANVCISNKDAI